MPESTPHLPAQRAGVPRDPVPLRGTVRKRFEELMEADVAVRPHLLEDWRRRRRAWVAEVERLWQRFNRPEQPDALEHDHDQAGWTIRPPDC